MRKMNKVFLAIGVIVLILFFIAVISIFMPVEPVGIYNIHHLATLQKNSRAICIMTEGKKAILVCYDISCGNITYTAQGEWKNVNDRTILIRFNVEGEVLIKKAKAYWWGMLFYEDDGEKYESFKYF